MIFRNLIEESRRVVVGNDEVFRLALVCLLAKGHLLIEDEPGMGKTTISKVFAKLLNLDFSRIQFTADLLPADIVGTSIYRSEIKAFEFHKGPIFANMVLGDELNRASPRTQSAFLQAMEERQVSVDHQHLKLPSPFFMMATQNPRSSIGTFPLPESQLDRFMVKTRLAVPTADQELEILLRKGSARGCSIDDLQAVCSLEQVRQAQVEVDQIAVSERVARYVRDISQACRKASHPISTRASLALLDASKANAWIENRDFVTPDDIQLVVHPVLAHRISMSDQFDFLAAAERLEQIIEDVEVL